MSVRLLALAVLGIVLRGFAAGQVPVYETPEENLPRVIAPQPIPFDHSKHAGQRIACDDCHPGAATAARAGLPGRDDCMLCHGTIAAGSEAVQRLASQPPGARIDWVRVYEVPGFVFFNHSEHVQQGVVCRECHGPVSERSVLAQEVSVSMVACMNCHSERGASNECFLCHDLGQ